MSKRIKMAKICTHSGSFHADESLAVYMLKCLPRFKDYELIRSRDPKDWEESEIVVDVSGKYDGVKFFDHHQREFDETFPGYKTKLSSAGLVYKHFGKDILQHKLQLNESQVKAGVVDSLYDKIYKEFIESIDANDNGVNKFDEEITQTPNFSDKSLSLPSIVSNLNPPWYEDPSPQDFDTQFTKSSQLMGDVFENVIKYYGISYLKSKDIVTKAIADRFSIDESGSIIKLDKYCNWKSHLYNIEKDENISEAVKFVLFEDSGKTWRISTVSINSGSFEFRQGIKSEWRGIRDQQLSEMVGIDDGVFVHASGFIGGAKSYDSVLKMARLSL